MEMSLKILLSLLILTFLNTCSKRECLLEPLEKGFEYIEANDQNFKRKFEDSIYLFTENIDYFKKEISKGNYLYLGDNFVMNGDTLFFNDLDPEEIDKKLLLNCFSKYIKKNKVVIIERPEDLEHYFSIINNQKREVYLKKWLFTVNCFRKNDKYAVFQLLYQPTTRGGFLGCMFIYDYDKKDFIEKVCDLPYNI